MKRDSIFLTLIALLGSQASALRAESVELLRADIATGLFEFDGPFFAKRAGVPENTLLRVIPSGMGKNAPKFFCRVEVVEKKPEKRIGWIDRRKCTNLTTIGKCFPFQFRLSAAGYTVAQFPELVAEGVPPLIKQKAREWDRRALEVSLLARTEKDKALAKKLRNDAVAIVKDWEEIRDIIQRAKPQPKFIATLIGIGDTPIGHAFAQDYLHTTSEYMPELYFARASMWRRVHNYHDALRDYIAATNLLDGSKRDLVKYAKYFIELRDVLGRLQKMPVAPRQYPDLADKYYAAGRGAYWRGSLSLAKQYFSYCIQLAPREPVYWYYRALTYKRLRNEGAALYDLRVAVDLEFEESNQRYRVYTEQDMADVVPKQLERVQGEIRMWISAFRSGDPELRYAGVE